MFFISFYILGDLSKAFIPLALDLRLRFAIALVTKIQSHNPNCRTSLKAFLLSLMVLFDLLGSICFLRELCSRLITLEIWKTDVGVIYVTRFAGLYLLIWLWTSRVFWCRSSRLMTLYFSMYLIILLCCHYSITLNLTDCCRNIVITFCFHSINFIVIMIIALSLSNIPKENWYSCLFSLVLSIYFILFVLDNWK